MAFQHPMSAGLDVESGSWRYGDIVEADRERRSRPQACQPRAWIGRHADLDHIVITADDIEERSGHRLARLVLLWLGGEPQQFIRAETHAGTNAKYPRAHQEKAHLALLFLRLRLVDALLAKLDWPSGQLTSPLDAFFSWHRWVDDPLDSRSGEILGAIGSRRRRLFSRL
jgi:hypothetical protein